MTRWQGDGRRADSDDRQRAAKPGRRDWDQLSVVCLVLITLPPAVLGVLIEENARPVGLLKVFAIVVLAFLPGWLYLRFVVFRAGAVWDEYVLNLHRLGMDESGYLPEPPACSVYHPEWEKGGGRQIGDCERNIYRQKFEAYYGKGASRPRKERQLQRDTLLPVFLTTAILAVGWTAVLAGDMVARDARPLPVDLLRFAFMGAYAFIIQMLIRRYFQSDLKPSAYISATVRVFTVLILVVVLHQVWNGDLPAGTETAVAFVVGFFPLVGLQALQKVAALALRVAVPSLRTDYPLSDLDGLNVWYEARLLEEGVEDMQNLVTANLVDVILHTRVPLGRLVDWVDQAQLYLHLEPVKRGVRHRDQDSSRARLRHLGIRTATDLKDAFERRAFERDDDELLEGLRWVLNDDDHRPPSVTQVVLKTLHRESNLQHVEAWKSSWRAEDRSTVPAAA